MRNILSKCRIRLARIRWRSLGELRQDASGAAAIIMGMALSLILMLVFALAIDHGRNYSTQSNMEAKMRSYSQYLAANYSYYLCTSAQPAATCISTNFCNALGNCTPGDTLWPNGTTGVSSVAALSWIDTVMLINLQKDPQLGYSETTQAVVGTNNSTPALQTLTFYAAVPAANSLNKGTTNSYCTLIQGTGTGAPYSASPGCVLASVTQVLEALAPVNGVCTATPASCTGNGESASCCQSGLEGPFVSNPDGTTSWSCQGSGPGSTSQTCQGTATNGVCPQPALKYVCPPPVSSPINEASSVSGNTTTYTWNCTSASGGASSPQCSTTCSGVPGACSPANGTPAYCAQGTFELLTGTAGAPVTWLCKGTDCNGNPAFSPVCTDEISINGSCNNAVQYGCLTGQPINESDNASSATDTVAFTWNCTGSGTPLGNNSAQCSWTTPVLCGAAVNTCAAGATVVAGSQADNGTTSSWNCTFGGGSVGCTHPDPPACGSTVNTCAPGTPTTGAGQGNNGTNTTWTCTFNGISSACSDADPVCGTTPNGCSIGSYVAGSQSNNGTKDTWLCASNGITTNPACSLNDPQCGATANTCTGSATLVAGSASDNGVNKIWTCTLNGLNSSCQIPDPPVCGATAGTCAPGTASLVNNNGTNTTWTCTYNGIAINSCSDADPQCGSAPTGASYCNVGAYVAGSQSDNGTNTTWQCSSNGITSAACSLNDPQCGTGIGGAWCSVGTLVAGSETPRGQTLVWNCGTGGSNNNVLTKACSSAGLCGGAVDACAGGASYVAGSQSNNGVDTSWSCTMDGLSVGCQLADPPVCGAAVNTCAPGTFSTGAGQGNNGTNTTWSCTYNGITINTCSDADPVCGGSLDACTVGSYVAGSQSNNGITDTWLCTNNGITSPVCSLSDPQCGGAVDTCSGSATFVAGSATDNGVDKLWSCSLNGLTAACQLPDPPACGSTVNTCAAGIASGETNNGTNTTWSCTYNGMTINTCSDADPVCGGTVDACIIGSYVAGSQSNNGTSTTWKCTNDGITTNPACSLNDPQCGVAAGTCSGGATLLAGSVTNNGTDIDWTCTFNGINAACQLPDPPVCGAAVNTCGAGTPSAEANNGTNSTWNCNFNSMSVGCSDADPVCGTNEMTCNVGTFVAGSEGNNGTTFTWQCTNSGINVPCSVLDPVCSSTSSDACDIGTVTNTFQNGNWDCGNGGLTVVCSPPSGSGGGCNQIPLHCSTCYMSASPPTKLYDITYSSPNACSTATFVCDGVGCPGAQCGCTGSPGF